jgi:hypothetical protein
MRRSRSPTSNAIVPPAVAVRPFPGKLVKASRPLPGKSYSTLFHPLRARTTYFLEHGTPLGKVTVTVMDGESRLTDRAATASKR